MFINEIAAKLAADGVGVIGNQSANGIMMGSNAVIPDTDGPFISLTATGGTAADLIHNEAPSNPAHGTAKTSQRIQRPSAQVLVRAATSNVAIAKAWAAYNSLTNVFNTTLSGTFYQQITAVQEPTDIGKDALGRVMISFNINAMKQPSVS